jgi:protein O-mannosyl-transferase
LNNDFIQPRSQKLFSITLLCLTILIVYNNTLWSTWHLDDIVNIVDNRNIRIQNWNFDNLKIACSSPFASGTGPQETIYRPVSMVTFAFNWFLGKYNVVGYHLINIVLHCVISILLYFTLLNLLSSPNIVSLDKDGKHFVAILATILWALHPIQIQAVTYIVQRMAILGALFYLSGIYFYLQMRNSRQSSFKAVYIVACLISYLMALGSKEHTVTMPAAILLIEIIFFKRPVAFQPAKPKWPFYFLLFIGAIFLFFLYFYLDHLLEIIFKLYRQRPFTLTQRLLTEFRVLIFYISQLYYPQAKRFSIMHDYPLSLSLLNPMTTIICCLTIISLILFSIFRFRKQPMLCFAILFYFLSQSVESSVIGLELIFEHRNYLSSLFIFLPMTYGFKYLLDRFLKKSSVFSIYLIFAATLLIFFFGFNTYLRNNQWENEQTLWQDAMQKAPFQARPYQNVAMYLDTHQKYHEALKLYYKALGAKDPNPELSRFISLSNIGNIYKKMSEFQNAIRYLEQAVKFKGEVNTTKVRYNLVICLLNSGKLDDAVEHLNFLIQKQKNNPQFLITRGFIFYKKKQYKDALDDLRLALKLNPHDKNGMLTMGMILSSTGSHSEAGKQLEAAIKKYPNDLALNFCFLEHTIKTGNQESVNECINNIFQRFSLKTLELFIINVNRGIIYMNDTLIPIDIFMIKCALSGYLK